MYKRFGLLSRDQIGKTLTSVLESLIFHDTKGSYEEVLWLVNVPFKRVLTYTVTLVPRWTDGRLTQHLSTGPAQLTLTSDLSRRVRHPRGRPPPFALWPHCGPLVYRLGPPNSPTTTYRPRHSRGPSGRVGTVSSWTPTSADTSTSSTDTTWRPSHGTPTTSSPSTRPRDRLSTPHSSPNRRRSRGTQSLSTLLFIGDVSGPTTCVTSTSAATLSPASVRDFPFLSVFVYESTPRGSKTWDEPVDSQLSTLWVNDSDDSRVKKSRTITIGGFTLRLALLPYKSDEDRPSFVCLWHRRQSLIDSITCRPSVFFFCLRQEDKSVISLSHSKSPILLRSKFTSKIIKLVPLVILWTGERIRPLGRG